MKNSDLDKQIEILQKRKSEIEQKISELRKKQKEEKVNLVLKAAAAAGLFDRTFEEIEAAFASQKTKKSTAGQIDEIGEIEK